MMYRKGGEAEYSAPCKWDNDAPYIAQSGNWFPEIIAARWGSSGLRAPLRRARRKAKATVSNGYRNCLMVGVTHWA